MIESETLFLVVKPTHLEKTLVAHVTDEKEIRGIHMNYSPLMNYPPLFFAHFGTCLRPSAGGENLRVLRLKNADFVRKIAF